MQTVLRVGSYRFFFYSGDHSEPAHVHVGRDDKVAKVWLEPVRYARTGRFSRAELREMKRLVSDHQDFLLEAWRGFFDR